MTQLQMQSIIQNGERKKNYLGFSIPINEAKEILHLWGAHKF